MTDEQACCAQLLPRLAEILVEARHRGTPTVALRRQLREVAPASITVDLAEERDPLTGEIQHDVVVMARAAGSFLLSFGPEDERPWVLRGEHHWASADLLRAGDEVLVMEEAVVMLEMMWSDPLISRKLVARALTKAEIRRRGLTLTDQQLEAFIERFRRSRGLLTGAGFEAWLEERGLTPQRFAEQMQLQAQAVLLRSQAGDAATYFQTHAPDLDQVTFATWWTPDRAKAHAIREALASGRSVWEMTALALPRFVHCFSGELPGGLAGTRRAPGDLVGPLPAPGRADRLVDGGTAAWQAFEVTTQDEGFAVHRIVAWEQARLDADTRAAIEQRLYDAWIDGLRRDYPVSWNWGQRRDDQAETG